MAEPFAFAPSARAMESLDHLTNIWCGMVLAPFAIAESAAKAWTSVLFQHATP